MLDVRVVDGPDGIKSFIRHSDRRILLQTSSDENGRMYIGFTDKALLPDWPKVPAWYPVEVAILDAINRHYLAQTRPASK